MAVGRRPGTRPRVLVLRALGLGDLLTAVPALRGLRRAFPDHRLTLAAPATLEPIAALSGAVDDLVDAAPLEPLPPRLAGVEVAVNLHGRGPESHRLLRTLRPGRLLAFAAPGLTEGPAWRPGEHEVDRWCRMLAGHGVAADPTDLRVTATPATGPHGGVVVVHPGAASPARRWPPERFGAVAAALRERGERIVVTGGPDEREAALAVARSAGLDERDVLAGRTDLLELAAIVSAARCVICGDTGVAHLATAAGTRSVVLFGPVPPACWGPRIDHDRHVVLWAGRTGDPHADRPDPGLLELQPEAVLSAARRLLDAGAVSPAPAG